MYSIAKLTSSDRKEYRESPEIVEKDFWVTVLLDYLFHKSMFKDAFTFKGGTSLSKCFGIKNRFSEDIISFDELMRKLKLLEKELNN